eukprot:GHRQ01010167.1.p2 GENE.GHRQ01010167.1~~GHRQ01010167.1.p2  ORF type:complete len:136 (-),score=22.05 GHRQ01010167.1:619-1026(-)
MCRQRQVSRTLSLLQQLQLVLATTQQQRFCRCVASSRAMNEWEWHHKRSNAVCNVYVPPLVRLLLSVRWLSSVRLSGAGPGLHSRRSLRRDTTSAAPLPASSDDTESVIVLHCCCSQGGRPARYAATPHAVPGCT